MSGKQSLKERVANRAEEQFRDLELEKQLVAYMVRKNPSVALTVDENWITDVLMQDIFRVVRETRVTMTEDMLWRELKARNAVPKADEGLYSDAVSEVFVTDIDDLTDQSARHLVTLLLQMDASRRLVEGAGDIIESIENFDLEQAQEKMRALSRPAKLEDRRTEGYYLEDYTERLEIVEEKRAQQEDSDQGPGFPTGIAQFDSITGGLMRGEFGVLAGIPGIGKTVGLVHFAISSWLAGYNCLLVSGEMGKGDLGFRIDAHLAEITANKFRVGALDETDYSRWDSTIERYKAEFDNWLYIATFSRGFTTEDIENTMLKVAEDTGNPVDAVFIDYLNIMKPTTEVRGSSRNWDSQADIVWDVKGLYQSHNITGWTANQVTDDAYKRTEYALKDLKYARAIGETAPIVAAIIRTEDSIYPLSLQMLKLRNSPLPKNHFITLNPNLDYMQLNTRSQQRAADGTKSLAALKGSVA